MSSATRFKQASVPRQPGELARLKVVHGADHGVTFVLTGKKILVGRGEDCDVMVADLKASRRHVEITLEKAGWSAKDLGSANGIFVNGSMAREAKLKSGDTITIGGTTLEFVSSDAATTFLAAPPKSMEQVMADQAKLAAQKDRVRSLGHMGSSSTPALPGPSPGGAMAGLQGATAVPGMMTGAPGLGGPVGSRPRSPASRKNMLLLGAAGLAAFMFLSESPSPKKPAAKKAARDGRDPAALLPPDVDMSGRTNRAAEMFFKIGFREFREKNYLRAQTQFENALQVSPGHRLARIYLENCRKAIEDEVKFHLEHGKKSQTSGKLRDAQAHYEAVMRILHRDRVNPHYSEARDQLQAVERELKEGRS